MEMYRKIRQMIHNNYLDLTKLWNRKDNYKNSFDAVLEELNGFVMNHEENNILLPRKISPSKVMKVVGQLRPKKYQMMMKIILMTELYGIEWRMLPARLLMNRIIKIMICI